MFSLKPRELSSADVQAMCSDEAEEADKTTEPA